MTSTNLTRVLLPSLLAAAGVYLLIGCIPLPGDFQRGGGESRPEASIGASQVGRVTREYVTGRLGPPTYETSDRGALAYRYAVRTGVWLFPLCFRAETVYGFRYLVVRFNSSGVLESYKVYKDLEEIPENEAFKEARRQRLLDNIRRRNAGARD